MKRFNNYKISLLLVVFVVILMLTVGSSNADFTFGQLVNLRTVIPVLDPAYDAIDCFSYDGLEMYIDSYRPGGYGGYDIYVLKRDSQDAAWGPPENLGLMVNSLTEESFACISADGLTLYFNSDRPGGYGYFDIYKTTRATKNDPWGTAVNMRPPICSTASDVCPWISADGLEVYFGSYRTGGYGLCDIYVARRATESDPWGIAENLGPVVNSAYEDQFLSLSPDGLLLLFSDHPRASSFRPGGYGGADIWLARRASLSDPWQTPVNLGPKVNSSKHDNAPRISPDGRMLYIWTTRNGSWENYQASINPIGFNGDAIVNLKDLSILTQYWDQNEPSVDIGPMPWGDGIVDIQDVAVLVEYWLKDITELGQAWGPTPADGATNQPKSVLYWNTGETAVAHDVYFGTDRTAVKNANTSSAEFLGETTLLYSTAALALQQQSTTYYWRIDEVEADGVTIIKGVVWTFTTAPLKAHSPSPADNALLVDPNTALSWGPGFTAKYHEIYLGTDRTDVEDADTSSPLYKGRKVSGYNPSTLSLDTTYYWRVDEVETVQTIKYKGDVWQFQTIGTGQ